MKNTVLLIVLLSLTNIVVAQIPRENKNEKSLATEESKVKLYGFVRNYYYYDSRKCLQSSGGLSNQIPMDRNQNIFGEDLNAVPNARMLAITTRMGLNVSGPEILGAKSSAKIEADFSGFSSSTTMLRVRHAYFKFDWKRHELLCGQTWHPFIGDLMPDVLGSAKGSPFSPYNRSPQVRYDFSLGAMKLSAATLFQLQYTSVGPNGASADYSKNSILPELLGEISYDRGDCMAGIGIDYLQIRPRTSGYISDVEVLVDDRVAGLSATAYWGYLHKKLLLKARCTYGQNVAHLNMMSGYGVTQKNADGSYEYAPLNSLASWINITYGTKIKVGLFLGHMKNLGANKSFVSMSDVYVRGYKNIGSMYRINPLVLYNFSKFNIGIENEVTTVAYGERVDENGKVSDLHNVTNNRICLMMKYNF